MKASYILAAALFLAGASCERHEWKDVKVLHEPHHGHGEGHGEEHGDHGESHEEKAEH